jgi:chromosome segregation ATPase
MGAEVEALRAKVKATETEAQGVISAWEAKVAQLNDELEDARSELEEADLDKQEALEASKAEAEERFTREVGLLRGLLDKLRNQVSIKNTFYL